MKRVLSLLGAMTVGISLSITSVSAASSQPKGQQEKIIYHKKEITDLNQLFQRAKEGKNDIPIADIKFLPKYQLSNNSTKKEGQVQQYETTQLLDETQQGTTVTKTIAETNFAIVPSNSLKSTNSTAAPSTTPAASSHTVLPLTDGGSNYNYGWDSSDAIRANSTIYYTETVESDGNTYAKLTSASGGWSIYDSSVSLSGRTVNMGTSGWPCGTQRVTYYPTGNTWRYSAPSTWQYASLASGHSIGATSIVTLKRGTSSTWSLTLSNNI